MDIDHEDLPSFDWRGHLPARWEVATILLSALMVGALAAYVLTA